MIRLRHQCCTRPQILNPHRTRSGCLFLIVALLAGMIWLLHPSPAHAQASPPDAPAVLVAADIDPTAARVDWTTPADNGAAIENYRVECHSTLPEWCHVGGQHGRLRNEGIEQPGQCCVRPRHHRNILCAVSAEPTICQPSVVQNFSWAVRVGAGWLTDRRRKSSPRAWHRCSVAPAAPRASCQRDWGRSSGALPSPLRRSAARR